MTVTSRNTLLSPSVPRCFFSRGCLSNPLDPDLEHSTASRHGVFSHGCISTISPSLGTCPSNVVPSASALAVQEQSCGNGGEDGLDSLCSAEYDCPWFLLHQNENYDGVLTWPRGLHCYSHLLRWDLQERVKPKCRQGSSELYRDSHTAQLDLSQYLCLKNCFGYCQ